MGSRTLSSSSNRRWLAAIAGAAATALLAPAAAAAVTIDVTTTADEFNSSPGACSLREAIWAANNDAVSPTSGCPPGSGADTIEIPAGTYSLDRSGQNENADVSGDLDVSSAVTIRHLGPGQAVVDAKGTDRVFNTFGLAGVTITGLTIQGGSSPTGTSGGGILNSGRLTVADSTITANSSGLHGGGIESAGAAANLGLINSTVSGNRALVDGGGIDQSGGQVTLLSTTVTANTADADSNTTGSGGGIGVFITGSAFTTRSTLDAGNIDNGGQAPDCFVQTTTTLSSLGETLIGNGSGCTLTGGPGDIVGANPRLAPLADNGGLAPTNALRRRSAAIDRGTGCPPTDQRGVPRSLGGVCDIGAYELVRCKGRPATRVGTNGPDRLVGTQGRDVFLLLGGNDVAKGLGGNDSSCGGAGNDELIGGPGRDREYGNTGRDLLLGDAGPDRLFGGAGNDRLRGGAGKDRLHGGVGKDACDGGTGRIDRAFTCEISRKVP